MEQKEMDYLASLGPVMPGDIKPAQIGWYARDYGEYVQPSQRWLQPRDFWDGEDWWLGDDAGNLVSLDRDSAIAWRGLAEPHTEQHGSIILTMDIGPSEDFMIPEMLGSMDAPPIPRARPAAYVLATLLVAAIALGLLHFVPGVSV